jgi:tetratricopeptide (TPR) repeat protein
MDTTVSRDSSLKALKLTPSGSHEGSSSEPGSETKSEPGADVHPAEPSDPALAESETASASTSDGAAAADAESAANLSLEMPAAEGAGAADLEHGFFSRGLSEEHLRAASEEQGEEELFAPLTSGRRRRIALGVCSVLVLGMVALGVRSFFTDRSEVAQSAVGAPAPLTTVTEAPPAPVVPSPETMPAELVPPIGSLQRVASVDQLRARVPEGPAPEGAEGQAPEAQVAEARIATGAAAAAEAPAPSTPEGTTPTTPAGTPAAAAPSAASNAQVAACTGVLRSGRFRDIETKCKAAFDAQPAAPLAAEVAQAALELGRNVDAAAWARRAIGVDPKHADAFVLLGGAEQQLGHSAEAKAAYSRYLELAPNGQHAQDVRALLPRLAGM